MAFDRITVEPDKLEGKPCIRGMCITVETAHRHLARCSARPRPRCTRGIRARDHRVGARRRSDDHLCGHRHRVEFLVSCLEQLEAQLQAGAMVTVTRPGSEYADCRCGRQRRLPLQPVGGLLREVDTGAASLLRFRDPLDLSRFGEPPVLPPCAPPAMATSATTARR